MDPDARKRASLQLALAHLRAAVHQRVTPAVDSSQHMVGSHADRHTVVHTGSGMHLARQVVIGSDAVAEGLQRRNGHRQQGWGSPLLARTSTPVHTSCHELLTRGP